MVKSQGVETGASFTLLLFPSMAKKKTTLPTAIDYSRVVNQKTVLVLESLRCVVDASWSGPERDSWQDVLAAIEIAVAKHDPAFVIGEADDSISAEDWGSKEEDTRSMVWPSTAPCSRPADSFPSSTLVIPQLDPTKRSRPRTRDVVMMTQQLSKKRVSTPSKTTASPMNVPRRASSSFTSTLPPSSPRIVRSPWFSGVCTRSFNHTMTSDW